MSETSALRARVRERTRFESAAIALRLAQSIAARFGEGSPAGAESRDALSAALRFATEFASGFGVRADNAQAWRSEVSRLRAEPSHPISRIAQVFPARVDGDLLADLVLLCALPNVHEAFAVLCRL